MGAGFRAALVFTFAIGVTLATKQNVFARLIDDLFDDAGYAKDAIPMKKPADKSSNINSINVAVGVSVISMDLEPRGVLSASTWLRTSWEDYRLQWDPNQYEGLDKINIPSNRVWKPDLSVYNSADFGSGSFQDLYDSDITNALVYSTGKVLWIPAIPIKVNCNKDEVLMGEDENSPQGCNIMVGSWTYDGFHLNLTAYGGEEYLELGDFAKNSPYVIKSQEGEAMKTKYYSCCEEPYMSMNFKFTVQKAFSIIGGEKVFNISPAELEELYGQYKTTFSGNK